MKLDANVKIRQHKPCFTRVINLQVTGSSPDDEYPLLQSAFLSCMMTQDIIRKGPHSARYHWKRAPYCKISFEKAPIVQDIIRKGLHSARYYPKRPPKRKILSEKAPCRRPLNVPYNRAYDSTTRTSTSTS